MPDLRYAISNEVYKEYKVLWTSVLLGSECYSAQLAELFLLSRAFSDIRHIHFESNCASASKHHLYHCIRGCNVLWWICKSAWFCPLLLLLLNLWMKSSFCYQCLFGGKQSEYTEIQQKKNNEEALVGLKGMKSKQVRVTQSIWALWRRALTAEFSLPPETYCLVM